MTAHRNQADAMIRRYGRELTNREIAEASTRRTPPLRLRATGPIRRPRDATANTLIEGLAEESLSLEAQEAIIAV